MAKRTLDDDLDEVLRLGYGRRVLASIVREGMVDCPLGATPQETAFNLGMQQAARNLDRRLRAINGDAWLIMHKEILTAEEDEDKVMPHDAP